MVTKRIALAALLAPGLGRTGFAAADVIDKPVATVKLTRLEAITAKQFRQKVEMLEERSQEHALPGRPQEAAGPAHRRNPDQAGRGAGKHHGHPGGDRTPASEQAKKSGGLSLNLNRDLTDAEFKSLLQQSGVTWEEYNDQLQKALLQQKYVMQKKKAAFDAVGQPSEAEVLDFYESNKTRFVAPEIVRFKHIFIDTRNLADKQERDKARERAEQIDRELKNGASFDELVVKYSDDKASRYKGGDFGYLLRDDPAAQAAPGQGLLRHPLQDEG